jgi:hypothetical protein
VEISGGAVLSKGRTPVPRVVPCARPLDLDHLRAEVREQLPCPGAGEDPRELEHLQAGQRLVHQKAAIPVIARPRISPWTSCVPS